jgi:hypothetical protein
MQVEIDVCSVETIDKQGNLDEKRIRIYSEVENWDICETVSEVFKWAKKEYGH